MLNSRKESRTKDECNGDDNAKIGVTRKDKIENKDIRYSIRVAQISVET